MSAARSLLKDDRLWPGGCRLARCTKVVRYLRYSTRAGRTAVIAVLDPNLTFGQARSCKRPRHNPLGLGAARKHSAAENSRGPGRDDQGTDAQICYETGRKIERAKKGSDVMLISCSVPSNNAESFAPEVLNKIFITRSVPVTVLRTRSAPCSTRYIR
jgi:hypothetical protein